jgi:Domain of unknown function (DUF1707)
MIPNEHKVRAEALTPACAPSGVEFPRSHPSLARAPPGYPVPGSVRGEEASMISGPEGEMAARAADAGRMRASHADRNGVVDVLKAAFIEGRLTKDELDARLSQTLAARTHAELAALTADIPPGTKLARLPRPERAPAPQSTHWVTHQAVKAGAATIGGLVLAVSALGIVAGNPAIGIALAVFIVILAAVASALVGSLVGATLMLESRRRRRRSRRRSPTRPGSGASGDQALPRGHALGIAGARAGE